MLIKLIFATGLLIISLNFYGQKKIWIRGDDSIKISVSQTANKKFRIIKESLLEPISSDTFFLPTKAMMYDKITTFPKTDSLKHAIQDSVKKYLSDSNSIEVLIISQKSSERDSVAQTKSDHRKTDAEHQIPSNSTDRTKTIMFGIIGLFLIGGVLYYFFFRKKKRFPSKDNSDIHEKQNPILSALIANGFPNLSKKKDPRKQAQIILEEFQRKESLVFSLQASLEDSNNKMNLLSNQLNALKEEEVNKQNEISELSKKITEHEHQRAKEEADSKEFNFLAEKLIQKYFIETSQKLRENTSMSEKETEEFVLKNIFGLAFHSASLLKKHIKQSSEHDDLNIQLLQGLAAKPTNVVTSNSEYSASSPLVYYIFKLMKDHGADRLDDVFVQGYKLGE